VLDKKQSDLEKLEKDRLTELERWLICPGRSQKLLLETVEEGARRTWPASSAKSSRSKEEASGGRARSSSWLFAHRRRPDRGSVGLNRAASSDDMKADHRRQGRNIRALENATGVDLVVTIRPRRCYCPALIPCGARSPVWR